LFGSFADVVADVVCFPCCCCIELVVEPVVAAVGGVAEPVELASDVDEKSLFI